MSELSAHTLDRLKEVFVSFTEQIFALQDEAASDGQGNVLNQVMQVVLDLRLQARTNKDWSTSDKIRDALKEAGIVVKDGKEGANWTIES